MNKLFKNELLILLIAVSACFSSFAMAENKTAQTAPTTSKNVANSSNWQVVQDGSGSRYVTKGARASGHQFGFAKLNKHCDVNLIWLLLSSKEKGVKSLKGQKADIYMKIDDVTTLGPLKLDVTEVTQVDATYSAVLFTSSANKTIQNLIDVMANSKSVVVEVASPDIVVSKLQIKADKFALSGLKEASQKAAKLCKK